MFGFAAGLIGTILSATLNQLPAGPIIVLTGTALFLISLLFGTRRGAIARLIEHLRFQRTWRERQFLRAIYEASQAAPVRARGRLTARRIMGHRAWTSSQMHRMLFAALDDGLVVATSRRRFALTPAGIQRAIEVTRGQRLWEVFLTEYPDQAASVVNLASIRSRISFPQPLSRH